MPRSIDTDAQDLMVRLSALTTALQSIPEQIEQGFSELHELMEFVSPWPIGLQPGQTFTLNLPTSNPFLVETVLITSVPTGEQIDGNETFTVPNPAPATGFTFTVPDELNIQAVTFNLATSATAGTRAPQVAFYDPAGNLITASTAGGDGSTSATRVATFTPYAQAAASVANGVVSGAIPNLTLQPGSTIVVSMAPGAGFQAGDQISGATVTGSVGSQPAVGTPLAQLAVGRATFVSCAPGTETWGGVHLLASAGGLSGQPTFTALIQGNFQFAITGRQMSTRSTVR
jgi:hypothetical protein